MLLTAFPQVDTAGMKGENTTTKTELQKLSLMDAREALAEAVASRRFVQVRGRDHCGREARRDRCGAVRWRCIQGGGEDGRESHRQEG